MSSDIIRRINTTPLLQNGILDSQLSINPEYCIPEKQVFWSPNFLLKQQTFFQITIHPTIQKKIRRVKNKTVTQEIINPNSWNNRLLDIQTKRKLPRNQTCRNIQKTTKHTYQKTSLKIKINSAQQENNSTFWIYIFL